MPRLLLVSLGQLNGTIVEHAARAGDFDHITIATRNTAAAEAKANNARIGAAIEGRFPLIDVHPFDLNAGDAGRRLQALAPDVTLAAPSTLPWWRLEALPSPFGPIATSAPFATFVACHLAPMLRLRDAWVASGLTSPWLGASYPDVVNHVLACTGEAPLCGVGNVLEAVPKVRLLAAGVLAADPREVQVRLVAQHAFEYHIYGDGVPAPHPPFLLQATGRGRDVSQAVAERLFHPCPLPYASDFNHLTASAAMPVLRALLGTTPVHTHVPAPRGLLGGYPVALSANGVDLDLAPGWSTAQAEAVNRESLPFDGIDEVDGDGRIRFTAPTARALSGLLGRQVESLEPAAAAALAAEIAACTGA
jgi:hypothetical protein